jgi:type VI protein secretion system component Hcp
MKIRMLTVFVALLLCPGVVQAGWSGFLRLDGAPGDSQNANHVGWITVSATSSANITNVSKAGGPFTTGTENALVFTKNIDIASTELNFLCAQGHNIASGTLDITTTNTAVPVLRLELTNICISSVTQTINSGKPTATEQVLLLAQVAKWNYAEFNTNSGLPSYAFSYWNFSQRGGIAAANKPGTITTGIQLANGGVQLSWNAVSGKSYCVFAVPRLGMPYTALASQMATNTGIMTFNMPAANNALFYVVDVLP